MKATIIFVALSMALLSIATSAWADDTDLVWSTFLGGAGGEYAGGIAIDGAGNVYISGATSSANFPTTAGALDSTLGGGSDAFVTKLSPSGSDLIYSTFLGGNNSDWSYRIALDSDGNAYVTGATDSYNFPVTPTAFDTSLNDTLVPPSFDAFVAKLNPLGSDLVYSTYLGATERDDEGYGIAVDGSGKAYVTGACWGTDFPITPGAFDTTHNGLTDIFVVKFNSTGSDLDYSTFLGGESHEAGFSIALDGSGNAYVTGDCWSANFPTTAGTFDATHNGGEDAFAAKLDASGSTLHYATYLGGNEDDAGSDVAVDGFGCAYLVGRAFSPGFPITAGAFDPIHNGSGDGFVVKLNPTGDALEFATFLGGSEYEGVWGITLDNAGYLYLCGQTESADFPTTSEAFDAIYNGVTDAFVGKLNPTGSSLAYSTFLGGSDFDYASWDIPLDGSDQACLLGGTYSADFPTSSGAFDTTYNGGEDAFVVKFDLSGYSVPVVLTTFEATGGQGFIILKWVTASEVKCHRWDIYRSKQEDGEYTRVGELPGHGSTEIIHLYHWVDSSIDTGIAYFYKLKQIDLDGTSWWSHVVSATPGAALPQTYALHQNYPNPFNPNTEITYEVPKNSHVSLKIFNVLGQEIMTLVDDHLTADSYTANWNGRDSNSNKVSAGIYFCTMKAGEFTQTRKMVLLR